MVEEGVIKMPLSLKEIYNWLSKSRRSYYRLPLPAPYTLIIPLLSRRILILSWNIIEAELAIVD
jgi:hypothetical protein